MPDVVPFETRQRMMAGIRGKNTRPEVALRKALHRRGFRYRLHDGRLPGKPDLVFPSRRAVIMVHGCFWHGHSCHLFKWPSSRKEFWRSKIEGNRRRDAGVLTDLAAAGWRVLIVWECAMKGRTRLDWESLVEQVVTWLASDSRYLELEGTDHGTRRS